MKLHLLLGDAQSLADHPAALRGRGARGVALAAIAGLSLAACSAASTMLNKSNLDIQTHMSETVFLDPVADNKKTIYLAVRNTSDHSEINLREPIAEKLAERGYRIVPDPAAAHFIMQLNVLQAGPIDPGSKDTLLSSDYGSGLGALAVGAGAGGLTQFATGNSGASVGVGLGLAAASFLADQLVKDVYYTVVTDIQISVRPTKGGSVSENISTRRTTANGSSQSHSSSGVGASSGVSNYSGSETGSSNTREQFISTNADFIKYNVRDVAYANQVNLKLEQAVPLLVDRLSNSVANLYE